MKRIFLMATAAVAALAMSSCSKEEQTPLNSEEVTMTLSASVDQQSDTKATIGGDSNWQFSFETGDEVKVTNSEVLSSSTYYTFTKGESKFTSSDAQATSAKADWYAFSPGISINLTGQTGTKDNAADHFGYAGKQEGVEAGTMSLNMTLSPTMAVLEIVNWSGAISISAMTGEKYVTGMTAATGDTPSFTVSTSTTKSTLLTADNYGIYYIAVPAGVALSFYNNDDVITGKTGTSFTLVAGKHYKLTVGTAPDGFEMVEYLESTGTQYINTAITASQMLTKSGAEVQMKLEFTSSGTGEYCANGWSNNAQIGIKTSGPYWQNYNTGEQKLEYNTVYVATLNCKDGTLSVPHFDSVKAHGITSNGANFHIYNTSGSSFPAWEKVYYTTMKGENGVLLRSFIPAICKSGASYTDGNTGESSGTLTAAKPGMYDTVSGRFFVNKGTGEFTYPTAE